MSEHNSSSRTMKGEVIRVSSAKTAIVRIERSYTHPKYGKRINEHSNIMVHDEVGVKVGDIVSIEETRPISKQKRHKIKEKL